MKIRGVGCYLFGILWLFTCGLAADGALEVYQAAERDLPRFIGGIAMGEEPTYGFLNREECQRIRLGRPYQLITIDPDIRNGRYTQRFSHFRPLPVWRFPLICGGTIRSLFTVARVRGQWKGVALGAACLAKEINNLETAMTAEQLGKRRSFVRLFQMGMDFILISDSDHPDDLRAGTLIPLISARMLLPPSQRRAGKISVEQLYRLLKEFPVSTAKPVRGNHD